VAVNDATGGVTVDNAVEETSGRRAADVTPPIVVNNLSRRFGRLAALDGVGFRAEPGRIFGLVGVNGAGKTTLIKHLIGRLRAKSGSVRVIGPDPVRQPVAVLRPVGYLTEERDVPEWMRIDDLLRYLQANSPAWHTGYARRLLESFGLDPNKRI